MMNLFFDEMAPEGFIHLLADEYAFADFRFGKGAEGKFSFHIVEAEAAFEDAFGTADIASCFGLKMLLEGSKIGFGKDFFRFGI